MPSLTDGLAIKHTAAHTWHSSVRASQPPKSRSHFYFLGAGMWEWVEGPGCEKAPQMFYKKEVNLYFRQSDLLESPDCFLGEFFEF